MPPAASSLALASGALTPISPTGLDESKTTEAPRSLYYSSKVTAAGLLHDAGRVALVGQSPLPQPSPRAPLSIDPAAPNGMDGCLGSEVTHRDRRDTDELRRAVCWILCLATPPQ